MHTIFLFRHGQTDWNLAERFQGHLDIPLNDTGREEARKMIEILRKEGLQTILSSDLSRAFETGRIIAESLNIPIFSDKALRESHMGAAQGLTPKEIEAKLGIKVSHGDPKSLISDADFSYPGGETSREVVRRVLQCLQDFMNTQPFSCIGIATHGGVIRRVIQHLTNSTEPVNTPNGAIFKILFNSQLQKFLLP